MSQENVRIVQAGIEAYNAQNWDALREMHDPSVIARAIEGWPEPGPYVGRDAVMRQFARVRAAWDTDAIEPIDDFLDAGDRVIVRVFFHGSGFGPEANLEFTIVYTVRERKIFFIEYFWDHAEALEAAGLRE
jgi:ketosteroid isomerase-like protein